MTDNEIIKALKCCSSSDGITDCECCPYHKNGCLDKVHNDAINLINRQKAEIKRMEKENSKTFNKWLVLYKRTRERYAELYEEAKDVVRAEAIKEFAERLKEPFEIYWDAEEADALHMVGMIDCLVKEMVGEGNKQRKEDEGK